MDERFSAEERELVAALMQRGWYRDGPGEPSGFGTSIWRFRQGHCLDDPHRQVIVLRAATLRAAMRTLLASLDTRQASVLATEPHTR